MIQQSRPSDFMVADGFVDLAASGAAGFIFIDLADSGAADLDSENLVTGGASTDFTVAGSESMAITFVSAGSVCKSLAPECHHTIFRSAHGSRTVSDKATS